MRGRCHTTAGSAPVCTANHGKRGFTTSDTSGDPRAATALDAPRKYPSMRPPRAGLTAASLLQRSQWTGAHSPELPPFHSPAGFETKAPRPGSGSISARRLATSRESQHRLRVGARRGRRFQLRKVPTPAKEREHRPEQPRPEDEEGEGNYA